MRGVEADDGCMEGTSIQVVVFVCCMNQPESLDRESEVSSFPVSPFSIRVHSNREECCARFLAGDFLRRWFEWSR